jgi:Protein of unknown function (DUF3102)
MTTNHQQLSQTPEDLIEEVNRLYRRVFPAYGTHADKLIEIGEILCKLKSLVPHEEWRIWVKDNLDISHRNSKRYLRLYMIETKFTKEIRTIEEALVQNKK